jgi:hypothetical protein
MSSFVSSPLAGAPGPRRAFSTVVLLGAPASGKSSLMVELADGALRRGRDVRVCDPAGNWPGVGEWPAADDDPRTDAQIADDWLKPILRARTKPKEGLAALTWEPPPPLTLLSDDADTFLYGGGARGPWRRLFTTFRHYRIDHVITGRRTQDLPKIVFTSATYVYLFRHFVSTHYIAEEYGEAVEASIPTEPFRYALFNVATREISYGETVPRDVKTLADG